MTDLARAGMTDLARAGVTEEGVGVAEVWARGVTVGARVWRRQRALGDNPGGC